MARNARGFTLIELVVTLALVGIVALVAMPLFEVTATHSKEMELRIALRTIRTALDAYKQATDDGLIAKDTNASGYPPSLDALVDGVDSMKDGQPKMFFLRQIPRDPMFEDQTVPPVAQWQVRSYASPHDSPAPGDDVFDVASNSARVGSSGVPYKDW